MSNMKYKVNGDGNRTLDIKPKPKLSKYKPQNIGKPNLQEIKSTSYNTGGMYL